MEMYIGERGEGKSTKAVLLSVEKQMPIICGGIFHKSRIISIAKELGVLDKLPEPILVEERLHRLINNNKKTGLIIDELNFILDTAFGDKVEYATVSSGLTKINSLKDGYITEIWKEDKLIITNHSNSLEEATNWYKKYYEDICNKDKSYKMFIYKNK